MPLPCSPDGAVLDGPLGLAAGPRSCVRTVQSTLSRAGVLCTRPRSLWQRATRGESRVGAGCNTAPAAAAAAEAWHQPACFLCGKAELLVLPCSAHTPIWRDCRYAHHTHTCCSTLTHPHTCCSAAGHSALQPLLLVGTAARWGGRGARRAVTGLYEQDWQPPSTCL